MDRISELLEGIEHDFRLCTKVEAELRSYNTGTADLISNLHLEKADVIAGLERILGRPVARQAPGRKPRNTAEGTEKLL
jgi:hypothetical protein